MHASAWVASRETFWNNKIARVTESMYLFRPWLERGNVKESILKETN